MEDQSTSRPTPKEAELLIEEKVFSRGHKLRQYLFYFVITPGVILVAFFSHKFRQERLEKACINSAVAGMQICMEGATLKGYAVHTNGAYWWKCDWQSNTSERAVSERIIEALKLE